MQQQWKWTEGAALGPLVHRSAILGVSVLLHSCSSCCPSIRQAALHGHSAAGCSDCSQPRQLWKVLNKGYRRKCQATQMTCRIEFKIIPIPFPNCSVWGDTQLPKLLLALYPSHTCSRAILGCQDGACQAGAGGGCKAWPGAQGEHHSQNYRQECQCREIGAKLQVWAPGA